MANWRPIFRPNILDIPTGNLKPERTQVASCESCIVFLSPNPTSPSPVGPRGTDSTRCGASQDVDCDVELASLRSTCVRSPSFKEVGDPPTSAYPCPEPAGGLRKVDRAPVPLDREGALYLPVNTQSRAEWW